MTRRRRLWPVFIAAAAGLAILMSLGFWQVERLAWKERLLTQLAANITSPPLSLAEAGARKAAGETITFRPVEITGKFRHAAEMRLISAYEGGPGWIVVTPLVTADGRSVLVDRGAIPDAVLAQIERPEGEVSITGLIRDDARRRGTFDPDNDPAANRWYWWDVPAMATAAGLAPDQTSDFIVQMVPVGEARGFPQPQPPAFGLRNNHLGYAITWFGLAAVLVAMTAAYVIAQRRGPSA